MASVDAGWHDDDAGRARRPRAVGDDLEHGPDADPRGCFGDPKRVDAPAARITAAIVIGPFWGRSGYDASMAGDARTDPIDGARYGHTNLIARDWRRLADWYERLFGCTPVPPERDYSGTRSRARHRRAERGPQGRAPPAPGHGDDGPTLEIYTFASTSGESEAGIDRPGFGHIAFAVADVDSARGRVLDEGGSAIGEVVTLTTADGRRVTWCYVADPEGNAVELQSWSPPA